MSSRGLQPVAKPKHKHKQERRFPPGYQKMLAADLTRRTLPRSNKAADLKRCCPSFPGKVMYPTLGWAEGACEHLRKKVTRGASLNVYRCPTCKHWHVGNNALLAFAPVEG